MTYINGSKSQFQKLLKLSDQGPLKMLNLLKFKSFVAGTDKSGAAVYQEYMKAAQPYFAAANAKVIFYGTAQLTLIGPEQKEWDKVLIVEYASKEDFLNMVMNPDYPSHIRSEALEDSRLIFCS